MPNAEAEELGTAVRQMAIGEEMRVEGRDKITTASKWFPGTVTRTSQTTFRVVYDEPDGSTSDYDEGAAETSLAYACDNTFFRREGDTAGDSAAAAAAPSSP